MCCWLWKISYKVPLGWKHTQCKECFQVINILNFITRWHIIGFCFESNQNTASSKFFLPKKIDQMVQNRMVCILDKFLCTRVVLCSFISFKKVEFFIFKQLNYSLNRIILLTLRMNWGSKKKNRKSVVK